jgi:hypothetical protein
MVDKRNFCTSCESFDCLDGYDYSGGPGVTKCGDCGSRNTVIGVPSDLCEDLIVGINGLDGSVLNRFCSQYLDGQIDEGAVECVEDVMDLIEE